MSRPLSTFTGNELYLDTMTFYVFLRSPDPTAKQLFTRLEAGVLHAYTSVLTFDELTYKLLLALIRDHYAGSPLDHIREREEQLIAEFYPRLAPLLEQLLTYPNLTLVDVTATDVLRMNDAILCYHLRPRDALHFAAMQTTGCLDMLSHDSDFDRVPDIQRYTLD